MAAFDQGQMPTIACINSATVALGVDFDALVAALQKYVDAHFAPVWGASAKVVRSADFVAGAWAMALLDNADVQNALGYHDLTPDGLPLSKVFVQTTIQAGQKVSVTASHELAEMLVDPAINLCSTGPKGLIYAYETADAVEEEEFRVESVAMSDFVYPAWFEGFRQPGSTRFDHLNKAGKPFEILKGGYMSVFKNGEWTQIFGSPAKKKRFSQEDRRGHRSGYRANHRFRRSTRRA
ncbi:MAG TPA: hypothetical protein VN887_06815 [Candidatus Angelobacter sp.]|nr:hypothetical protein [Candidatus Angelobacter sp.]